MTDASQPPAAAPAPRKRKRRTAGTNTVGLDLQTKRFVVIASVLVSSIIALVVIIVVAVMPIVMEGVTIPTTLQNWGGLIIGFYFGSFISLLKDWSRESVEVLTDDPDD